MEKWHTGKKFSSQVTELEKEEGKMEGRKGRKEKKILSPEMKRELKAKEIS